MAAALARGAPIFAGSEPPAVLVEDADQAGERPLLHLHNVVLESGGFLLMTARTPPPSWPQKLPDVRSRLQAALAVSLADPDDGLLAGVLMKLFADRQLLVADVVVPYLVSRMERSLAAAERLVDQIDQQSLAASLPIGLALARRVLHASSSDETGTEQDQLGFGF